MESVYEEALEYHKNLKGKLEVKLKSDLKDSKDLSIAYTPGVAEPCRKIAEDKNKVYDYTWKQNSVAVVTDGTAVLGLGDIGPEAIRKLEVEDMQLTVIIDSIGNDLYEIGKRKYLETL